MICQIKIIHGPMKFVVNICVATLSNVVFNSSSINTDTFSVSGRSGFWERGLRGRLLCTTIVHEGTMYLHREKIPGRALRNNYSICVGAQCHSVQLLPLQKIAGMLIHLLICAQALFLYTRNHHLEWLTRWPELYSNWMLILCIPTPWDWQLTFPPKNLVLVFGWNVFKNTPTHF